MSTGDYLHSSGAQCDMKGHVNGSLVYVHDCCLLVGRNVNHCTKEYLPWPTNQARSITCTLRQPIYMKEQYDLHLCLKFTR